MNTLGSNLRASASILLLGTVLFGGVYPLVVTGVAQAIFPHQANGSLIEKNGSVVGSALLGQEFSTPGYFWGRLSATTPPYNAAASAASNLNPANPKILDAANARIAALQQADPDNHLAIPSDLITASASGLDPHISLAAANYQLARVARARHMEKETVAALVKQHIENNTLALGNSAYVNVLALNLALDAAQHK